MTATIQSIYRYPVKGLSPEPLARADLKAGGYFPGDRLFAVENGPSGFDPAAPQHEPKIKFLMLMRNERLATLRTRYDDASGMLTIEHEGRQVLRADLATKDGRLAVEAFFRRFVSILNLASIAALETAIGAPVDPLRFRANLYVNGWPAWYEFDLVNREIAVGPAVRLKGVKRIERCAATNVDPVTGIRDMTIPHTLMRTWGHPDCGIYAEVMAGGEIATGDSITP